MDNNYIKELESKVDNDKLTIFEYLSMVVLPQENKSNENTLRFILFNNCNNINWDNAKEIIEREHPEMKGYEWNENCMYRLPYDPITKEHI